MGSPEWRLLSLLVGFGSEAGEETRRYTRSSLRFCATGFRPRFELLFSDGPALRHCVACDLCSPTPADASRQGQCRGMHV